MDREALETRLEAAFGGSEQARRVVSRQARDLADSGLVADHFGAELTTEDVVANMRDAPDGHTLVERWNWWVGSLEVSHGGYNRFRVRNDVG
jgi:hypothetical protein